MTRRKALTDTMVKNLKKGPKRLTIPDPDLRGHYVRVTTNGVKSYFVIARDPTGKQIWSTIKSTDDCSIDEARDKARERIKRIKAGLAPSEPPPVKPASFKDVAENYIKRYVADKGLRTRPEIERNLRIYVFPKWADRDFESIRRSDVAKLLDDVQDDNGPSQADHVLAMIRCVMKWHATRSDDYIPPIVPGMRRTDPKSRERSRILDDDEIRAVWSAAEDSGTFGAIIRLSLLTAQRRGKIAAMRWNEVDVDGDGVWNIPAEDREKGTAGAMVLPDIALEIIRSQYRIGNNPYVFTGRRNGRFRGFSSCKNGFKKRLAEDMPRWTLHDLRRTARSLMSKAGVRPDVAERVMGHTIGGVEGIYDRHDFRDEKAEALNKLAGLIALILNPPRDNVVTLEGAAR